MPLARKRVKLIDVAKIHGQSTKSLRPKNPIGFAHATPEGVTIWPAGELPKTPTRGREFVQYSAVAKKRSD